ncbi:MAG: DUF177 domain-containing protein [Bacilli bacterium]|nr:DUF177 domain-containing protein [Bacilli bacterium]
MNIDLIRLKNNIDKIINIDTTYKFNKEELKNTDLLDLKDIKIIGELKKDSLDDINLYLKVSGIMVLSCAITLEPVEHKFEFEIDDKLEEILTETENFNKKNENTIDILPIIWENILMEIPMRVVSPNAKPEKLKGNGWCFVTEPQHKINPELEKLKDLL